MNYKELLNDKYESLLKRKEELNVELASVTAEVNALSELFRLDSSSTPSTKTANSSSVYPISGNLKERIKYVLEQIGKGSASDIEDFMRQHETNVSSNSVTITASQLKKVGEIKGYRDGLKNIYHL